MSTSDFAVIGLGVMGRNLALNVADRGFKVSVWNLERHEIDRFVDANPTQDLQGVKDLPSLVKSLKRPRRLLIMIKAGRPVDEVLSQLSPLLDPGDIVIDGGNTHYRETRRREKEMANKGLCFMGMGVSGGEEGARRGPSLMPGGPKDAWTSLRPILESIAAKTDDGPCVTHVGPDGAGHFVKMVHNGIEYGDMQLIAEAYDLMNRGLGLDADAIAHVFNEWNKGPLSSFLIEITAKIFSVKDPQTNAPLVEQVLDKAGQKGTGRWTAEAALDLGVSIPTISAALVGRGMSALKELRGTASKVLTATGVDQAALSSESSSQAIKNLEQGLLLSKLCSYAQGIALIQAGSREYNWDVDLAEVARIWKGGCIIRATLLSTIREAYSHNAELPNLLLHPGLPTRNHAAVQAWRRSVALAAMHGIPAPALAGSLSYFDALRAPVLPQNLTQAQRDAFGAHTYQRTDNPTGPAVHSNWLG